jgi:ribonuclease BN (tRNA processing enzyme)
MPACRRQAGVKTSCYPTLFRQRIRRSTDQMWIDAARTHFAGTVIVGKDLMEI